MAQNGRGNGHDAPSYIPLVDLDPRLADAVLDLLAAEGIAAYARPATERPSGDVVIPRVSSVLDRVYVDAAQQRPARALLDDRLPGLRQDHAPPVVSERAADADAAEEPDRPEAPGGQGAPEDEVWSALVAAYDAPPAPEPVPRWPVAEDRSPGPPERAPVRFEKAPEPGPAEGEPAAPDAAEHHFVPPPPPPLPRTDVVTRWAWTGLVGAPLFLLLAALFDVPVSDWMLLLGAGGFVGGFVTLVARMEDGPRSGTGPDDGAVV